MNLLNDINLLIIKLGQVPGKIRKIIDSVLEATTLLLKLAESDAATDITSITNSIKDDKLRAALIEAIPIFNKRLQEAKDVASRQKTVGDIGKWVTGYLHGWKLDAAIYRGLFEMVFHQKKLKAALKK
jgi:hypothetical protein